MRLWPIVFVAAVALVGACSSSEDDDAASPDGTADHSGVAATDGDESAGGGAGRDTGSVAAVPVGVPLTVGRSVISTASAKVEVADVEVASRRAVGLATAAGGFLAAQDARLEDREIDLTLRVPSTRFHEVLDGVADLGEVLAADVRTQDVTEAVVDLEGRTVSARASIERLRALLDRAGDVVQLATVEGELAQREAELESLLGRLRVLEDQVDLSTIAVHLAEEEPAGDDELPGFLDAAGRGWAAFVTGARVVAAGVGFVLPFALLAALLAAAPVVLRRRAVPGRKGTA